MARIELQLPERQRLLPRELWLVYLVAPLMTGLLLSDLAAPFASATLWRQIAVSYGVFVVLGGAFQLLYATVMPTLLASTPTSHAQWALHVVATVAVAVPLGAALAPLHGALTGKNTPTALFIVHSVIISAATLFPALLIQQIRNKSLNAERLARAERQAALLAQLEALQSRTNPHFFFNSLNTVATLIQEDPALAERTLERLADLFRYALDAGRTRTVRLSREVEMVTDFLEIQAARFGDRLSFSVTMEPTAGETEVPPLLLQPLVENAILHGIGDRERGSVHVDARCEGDKVVIAVTDDGPGPGASSHQGNRTAVRDLEDRLRLIYPGVSSFCLEARNGGGCLARITVPISHGAPA